MTQLTAGLNRLSALLHMEMVVKIKKCEVIRNAESYDQLFVSWDFKLMKELLYLPLKC